MKTHPFGRCSPPQDLDLLLVLKRRRAELDCAIRLLEEIAIMRLRRAPELIAFVSRQRGNI